MNPRGIATNYSTTGLVGNGMYATTTGTLVGPVRVGIFAAHASNVDRVTSGSSYYGVMELSGNVGERCISVGNAQGRLFTGISGDGNISAFGLFNTSNWGNYTGGGFRGGSCAHAASSSKISERTGGSYPNNTRYYYLGGRGVRTAP